MSCKTCTTYEIMGFSQQCPCNHINGRCTTMQPPTKDQADIGVDNPTIDASDAPDNKDMTRQEFRDEADINYMLSRFGITQPRGTPVYGEWDDTIDLQVALQSVSDARTAYQQLPENLRDKFPSMEAMLTALENGSLLIKNEEAPSEAPPPAAPPA